ncbi:MAG: flagellar export protein FliJ [Firmicutes bacterium]|jgi:flagellar FliJ protein|nr:flagellar export protein FliJ [Bacillota bacterium]NLO65906.1 flagellar export protein FliJ [Bacillota bacterium]
MASFKFRLERVLKLRRTLEKQAKQVWGAQLALLHESEQVLAQLQEMKADVVEFGQRQNDVGLRQAMYSYLAALNNRIDRQIEVVKEQEKRTEEARQAWLKARQETKKIDILRDRAYARFIEEEQRKEQKELDDMRSYVQE